MDAGTCAPQVEAHFDAIPNHAIEWASPDWAPFHAHFEASGYDARPFYRTADLASDAKVQHYDGFVIDWIVGETSTLKLIAALREQDARSPIVVLTAQVLMGVVDETDIAEAVKAHGLVFSEKPVRMSILSATLAPAFAAAQ